MKTLDRFKELLRGHWIEVALALTAILVISAYGITEFPIVKDMGFFSYIGQEILRGYKPYSTVYEVKPPALFYFYAVAMSVFSFLPQYMSIRVFMLLVMALAIVLLYRIVLESTGDRLLSALSALIFLSFNYAMELAILGDSKYVGLLFSFLAILLSFRRKPLLAGACASVAFLFWQPFGVALFAPVAMLVMDGDLRPFKTGGFIKTAIGFAIPIAVLVAYFAYIGSLADLVDFSIVYALMYESQGIFYSGLWKLAMAAASFSSEFFFLVAGGVGALYVAWKFASETFKGRLWPTLQDNRRAVVFAVPFIMLALVFIKKFDGGSTFAVILPAISALAAMIFKKADERLTYALSSGLHLNVSTAAKVAAVAVLAVVCAYGFFPALQPVYPENPLFGGRKSFMNESTPFGFLEAVRKQYGLTNAVSMFLFGRPGEQTTVQQQLEVANMIRDGTLDNETVLSLGTPEILFLSGRRNMNPYPLFDEWPGFYDLSMQRGELPGIVSAIVAQKPKFILYTSPAFITKLGLDEFVKTNYVNADLMTYKIYELKSG